MSKKKGYKIMSENKSDGKVIANFLLNDLLGILRKKKIKIENCPISPEVLGFLCRTVNRGDLDRKSLIKFVVKWTEFNEK